MSEFTLWKSVVLIGLGHLGLALHVLDRAKPQVTAILLTIGAGIATACVLFG